MKTTFSRVFALITALTLLCLTLLGVTFHLTLRQYLAEEKQETLHSNAVALANLAAAYDATGELDHRFGDFHISLTTAAQVAGTDAMLCDSRGRVVICSCTDTGCVHWNAAVDSDLMELAVTFGEEFTEGTLGGLYEKEQFIDAIAVVSHDTGEPIGVIIVTAPQDQISGMVLKTTTLLCYVSAVVLLVAVLGSYVISRSQSQSFQAVADAATRFGHGELEARAPVGGKNTLEADELAAAFNTMADSLAQSERQRQEFVANVSHELKTPMTTIAGFMDGILDGTIPQSQHRHYMQLVSDEVRRLSRLVRSMLDISRLQSQGISEEKKRRFDLGESIGQVLISFEQRINRKKLMVDVQLPERTVWVKADPDSITQVLYNLTDNAIKFCNERGVLRIVLEPEGQKARVTIQNSGPTVDPSELPLLFDRFHKTDKSRSMDREGVGLGLYIVKTILDSHGENISVTSENGLTSFIFTLPMVR